MNVLLDVVLERQPFAAAATGVSDAAADGRLTGYVSAISVPTLYYIVRRIKGRDVAAQAVEMCTESFKICPVDEAIFRAARSFPGTDFEDNVQIACAMRASVDFIVTRDRTGYANSLIPALSPAELLARIASGR